MRRTTLGYGRLVKRTRGNALCRSGGCEKEITPGEVYIVFLKSGKGKRWFKTLHLRCVSPWLEYLAAEAIESPYNLGGRPELQLSPELKKLRASLYHKLRYITSKMQLAVALQDQLDKCEALAEQFGAVVTDIRDRTGVEYKEYKSDKASLIRAKFTERLKRLREEDERARMGTPERKRIVTPEEWRTKTTVETSEEATNKPNSGEWTQEQEEEMQNKLTEVLARSTKGYGTVPADQEGGYNQ
jgi:hypothetical protein